MPCSKRCKSTHLWEPQRVCDACCVYSQQAVALAILDPALRRSEASLQPINTLYLLPMLRTVKGEFNEGFVEGLEFRKWFVVVPFVVGLLL
jgi:hypothetical protein